MTDEELQTQDELGRCEFVSPVQAYWDTINRIRKDTKYGVPSAVNSSFTGRITYRATGEAEFEGKDGDLHPALELLERGERRWQAMVGREARTLR